MPVNTRHKLYAEQSALWKKMRDFVAGEEAVHAARELYLPRLSGESDTDYNARLARTSLFGATERTVEGLVGMLFRSTPECKVSPQAEKMLLDVTKSGENVHQYAAKCGTERMIVGKVATLTDYPAAAPGENLTVKQVEERNIRPHFARYTAESLINWEYGWRNNKTVLIMAVLEESFSEPNPVDPFVPLTGLQWRELRLLPGVDGAPDRYVQQLWRRPKDQPDADPVKYQGEIVPLMSGKPLAEIPLRITGDGKPPLLALCNVNKSHYQTTADLEHGAHRTALPQAWIAADLKVLNDETGKYETPELTIGGGDAWCLPQDATAGYLEYTGQGLGALEGRLASKEKQMAVLGARMLEAQKNGVEAADTAGMHRAGEQSILQMQAGDLSIDMEHSLITFDKWAGGSGEVKYQINKDFLPTMLTAQEIEARVAAWQAGAISKQELFNSFQRGGVVGEGADFETHETQIENNPPTLVAPGATPPGKTADQGVGGGD